MKTKLVLWGANDQDERTLIALELLPKENRINVFTFPETVATEEFSQRLFNEWRVGRPVPFPEEHTQAVRELSVAESMLPEGLKVERDDILQRAQTEWQFVVLSSKLNEAYLVELEELREKIEQLTAFDSGAWELLKAYWEKVQTQVRERNLFRDHANELRDKTNALFVRMKELRALEDEAFHRISKDNQGRFYQALDDIEERIGKGARLQSIFEELKKLQREFRDAKFTRSDRGKVWERLDAAFKAVKEKRFGSTASDSRSPLERLKRRYEGLMSAIEKMQRSINRDQKDHDFQSRKIARTDGQLEAQLRQAKIKMIEERIRSKEEKLAEMNKTKGELERRLEKMKAKEAQRAEEKRVEAARREAEAKIAKEIEEAAKARREAEKATAPDEGPAPEPPAMHTGLSHRLTELVKTLDAVAHAVTAAVEEAVQEVENDAPQSESPDVTAEAEQLEVGDPTSEGQPGD